MLTKTWYKVQVNSKIIVLDGYSSLLRLAKFDYFWIRVCAIVAISGIPKDNFTNFSKFSSRQNFLNDFVIIFSLPFFAILPSFYSVILESQGTIDFPVLPPEYQSLFCAHCSGGSVFPVPHSFLPFSSISSKVHGWLSILKCIDVTFLTVQFLAVLLLYFFSQMGGIPLCRFESPLLLIPFYNPSFWFLEVPSTCAVRGHSRFSSFIVGSLVPEKDVSILCFLCSFGFSFELS